MECLTPGLKIKWLGFLRNYNLKNPDLDLINQLRKNNIIVENPNRNDFEFNHFFSGCTIELNGERYWLNIEISIELYTICQLIVHNIIGDYATDETRIMFNLESFLNTKGKIEYLEKEYQQVFPLNDQEFASYTNFDNNPYYNWHVYFEVMIDSMDDFLINYLCYSKPVNTDLETLDWPCNLADIYNLIIEDLTSVDCRAEMLNFLNSWARCYKIDCLLKSIRRKKESLQEFKEDSEINKELNEILGEQYFNQLIEKMKNKLIIDKELNITIDKPSETKPFLSALCYKLLGTKRFSSNQKEMCQAIAEKFKADFNHKHYSYYKKHHFEGHSKDDHEYLDMFSFIS
jgi:hypothetical protein